MKESFVLIELKIHIPTDLVYKDTGELSFLRHIFEYFRIIVLHMMKLILVLTTVDSMLLRNVTVQHLLY